MSGGTQHAPRVRRNELARSLVRSFAVGIGVTVGFTILGNLAGVPEPLRMPLAVSAGFAIVMGGIHPAGAPNRWRRNLVAWSVPFAFMLLASLFMNWWRGV